jgi:hypothetical protein
MSSTLAGGSVRRACRPVIPAARSLRPDCRVDRAADRAQIVGMKTGTRVWNIAGFRIPIPSGFKPLTWLVELLARHEATITRKNATIVELRSKLMVTEETLEQVRREYRHILGSFATVWRSHPPTIDELHSMLTAAAKRLEEDRTSGNIGETTASARIKTAAELLSTVYPAGDVGNALKDLAAKAARDATGRATAEPRLAHAATETNYRTTEMLYVDSKRVVGLDSVIRGASYIIGATSIMSILATIMSGAIIIQPAFALLLLIAAFGFYCMTLVKD